ncbi:MAG: 6-phosphofructokinase, partial [Clostridia bacterium]|nr:6-phosphofructokinase [Clostridia bacterium]
KNCIVAQSGGPTAAINATLAGVIKGALNAPEIEKVYGSVNGVNGILNDKILELNPIFEKEENLNLLIQTPSSYLGSCRFKLPLYTEDETLYVNIFDAFEKYNIGFFFYIGGNDSMDTVDKLNDYAKFKNSDIKIMGVPKTVDNDLPVTDHTPGFASAAKYIAATVKEVSVDASVYDLKSVLIVEMMGRNAGWLTAASALARTKELPAPHLIYLPENDFDMDHFLDDVKEKVAQYGNIIVCVSEGIHFKDGTYVCESVSSGLTDVFNHKQMGGTAKVLENVIREKLGFKARGVELNVCQRCASHLTSKTDLTESVEIGSKAVEFALSGKSGEMVVFTRISDFPYQVKIDSVCIKEVANLEKCIPLDWITNNDVKQPVIDYILPLIQGEPSIIFENGLPVHLTRPAK